MTPEIGQLLLILALIAAGFAAFFPLIGAAAGDRAVGEAGRKASLIQFAFVAGAFAVLTYAHATSDFTVLNVYQNSHTAKPMLFKITGVWGNHEGSMLLWALILAAYGAAAALFAPKTALTARALSIQGMIATAFLSFILFTSNPFVRIFPAPQDGQDLNPLLQDIGLAVHPPFLYLGYVGFSMTFAFAVAGLISGRIDEAWARTVKPWALAAWTALTIGIALGSGWAYYELGWGGFWAWDPVENASFMPWLAGTALIHSIRALEVRGAFKSWTVLLAILAFSLSLIGTFLVRSGVLTSVHAFATDPARGLFILVILGVFIGGALTLFALKGPALTSNAAYSMASRETGLLVNNVILVAACATVFVGTFYPLFIDVATGEKISVGAPFFNIVFLPFMGFALLIIAPAAALAWKKGSLRDALRRTAPAAIAALAMGVLAFALYTPKSAGAIFGAMLAAWAGGGALVDFVRRVRLFEKNALSRIAALPSSYSAMTLSHLGFAIVAIGVIGAGVWKAETITFAEPGDTIAVGPYDVTLKDINEAGGPNYIAERATFDVARGKKKEAPMIAARRFYPVRGMQTTEAAIRADFSGDLYLTLGDSDPQKGHVVRAWRHPLVLFIWLGSALIALGGIVAMRGRARKRVSIEKPAAGTVAA
ncbi:MAG: heme lyase CcmF/NrfE family subunit [Parvularculaceae bacterium]